MFGDPEMVRFGKVILYSKRLRKAGMVLHAMCAARENVPCAVVETPARSSPAARSAGTEQWQTLKLSSGDTDLEQQIKE